jgi:predicted ester cyclase
VRRAAYAEVLAEDPRRGRRGDRGLTAAEIRLLLEYALGENKGIVRAYVETVWNRRQLERADGVGRRTSLITLQCPVVAGLEGAKRKWAMSLNAVPDLRVTIEELMAEGNKVAVRHSYEGTHRGSCWAYRPLVSSCRWAASAFSAG